MSFTQMNLASNIVKAISCCGYKLPTPVQAKCIPAIMNKKNLVASAPTGTGKTAAFVLPALHLIDGQASLKTPQKLFKKAKPRILILTPTRELATQITDAAALYGKFLRFRLATLVGGMPYRNQLRHLSQGPDMIVATPGRLMDHMQSGKLDLSAIEMFILDEADRMLDMGFIDDVKHIAAKISVKSQRLLFSATIDSRMAGVIRQLLKDPVKVDLSGEIRSPDQIKQKIYFADNFHHKHKLFKHILENEKFFKAIIFSATKVNADRLASELADMGYKTAALHGDLNQSKRNRTIAQFQRGKVQFLVATDVAARGIHVDDISHVINYDLPKFSEDYVHRIGRTGRAGKTGVAISFALPVDKRHLVKIERFIKQKISSEVISGMEPKNTGSSGAKPARRKASGRRSNSKGGKFADSTVNKRASHSRGRSGSAANKRSEPNEKRKSFSHKKKKNRT